MLLYSYSTSGKRLPFGLKHAFVSDPNTQIVYLSLGDVEDLL